MIDDPTMVARLMDRMQAHLPIPAYLTKALVRTLRQQKVNSSADRVLFIKSVLYGGDEGGIGCDLTATPDAKVAVVVSLTHLRFAPTHPLFGEIRAYQRERLKRLAEQGPSAGE